MDAVRHVGAAEAPPPQLRPEILDTVSEPGEASQMRLADAFECLGPVEDQERRIHALQQHFPDRRERGVIAGIVVRDPAVARAPEIVTEDLALAAEHPIEKLCCLVETRNEEGRVVVMLDGIRQGDDPPLAAARETVPRARS